jgi:hypothetical protein
VRSLSFAAFRVPKSTDPIAIFGSTSSRTGAKKQRDLRDCRTAGRPRELDRDHLNNGLSVVTIVGCPADIELSREPEP